MLINTPTIFDCTHTKRIRLITLTMEIGKLEKIIFGEDEGRCQDLRLGFGEGDEKLNLFGALIPKLTQHGRGNYGLWWI